MPENAHCFTHERLSLIPGHMLEQMGVVHDVKAGSREQQPISEIVRDDIETAGCEVDIHPVG
jgi:hypothetical protein